MSAVTDIMRRPLTSLEADRVGNIMFRTWLRHGIRVSRWLVEEFVKKERLS